MQALNNKKHYKPHLHTKKHATLPDAKKITSKRRLFSVDRKYYNRNKKIKHSVLYFIGNKFIRA